MHYITLSILKCAKSLLYSLSLPRLSLDNRLPYGCSVSTGAVPHTSARVAVYLDTGGFWKK